MLLTLESRDFCQSLSSAGMHRPKRWWWWAGARVWRQTDWVSARVLPFTSCVMVENLYNLHAHPSLKCEDKSAEHECVCEGPLAKGNADRDSCCHRWTAQAMPSSNYWGTLCRCQNLPPRVYFIYQERTPLKQKFL